MGWFGYCDRVVGLCLEEGVMSQFILAIDQGTTSSRAIIFDQNLKPVATGQQEFSNISGIRLGRTRPRGDLGFNSVLVCRQAMEHAKLSAEQIASIGITNQRETTVVWDKATGEPIYNAIVWQDRRTADLCQKLRADRMSLSLLRRQDCY